MNTFNNNEKNELLKDYYVDKKTFLIQIIISAIIILLVAVLIIILLTTTTNHLYENEEILTGYIPINSILATYQIDDINTPILLYNDKYSYYIHTIRVDGEKIDEVKNVYTFSTTGEHQVKLSLKKPLKTTEEFFINCENLKEVNLANLTTVDIQNATSMFSNCTNLESVDLSNFDALNLKNISKMFYNCNSLTSIDISNFSGDKLL